MNAKDERRFWSKVDKTGACWMWTAGQSHGYGRIKIQGRMYHAHEVAYALIVGPVPDGLVLDHTCHNDDQACQGGETCPHRRCVNPSHLEPVSFKENILRGKSPMAECARRTHCPQGHPYDVANTYINPAGARVCRKCKSERQMRCKRAARAKRRAAA